MKESELNTSQILNLGEWSAKELPEIEKLYSALLDGLRHNSSQPQRVSIREELASLQRSLSSMSFDILTNEEIDLMKDFSVFDYLGQDGLDFLKRVVVTSSYDPVNAVSDVSTVSRQGFWNQWLPNLREGLAHLVGLIMRRVCCDASGALRTSFV